MGLIENKEKEILYRRK